MIKKTFFYLLFLLAGLILSRPFFVQAETINDINPVEATQLTDQLEKELKSAVEKTDKVPYLKKERLEELSQQRLQALESLAKGNPSAVTPLLLEAPENGWPDEVKDLVEQENLVEGEVVIENKDYPDQPSNTQYFLENQDGEVPFELFFLKDDLAIDTGDRLAVEGYQLGESFFVQQAEVVEEADKLLEPQVSGNQSTIVILFNFNNDTSEPWSDVQVEEKIFTGSDSVNNYYLETSYGLASFSGDVAGWFTVPYPSGAGCSDLDRAYWTVAANSAATSAGVNLDSYSHRVYLFPRNESCEWAGLGTIGGNPSRMWSNGYNNTALFVHEIGHNLGMYHASFLDCGPNSIDRYDSCQLKEYDDLYDPLGYWNTFHLNAPHKIQSEWLPGASVATVTTDGTYSISSHESTNTGLHALKILKEDTDNYYYVEYRQAVGLDASLPSAIVSGAGIFVWDGEGNTQRLDLTPGDGISTNKTLADGAVFNDTINDLSISQTSHDSDSVDLQVQFGIDQCIDLAPSLILAPDSQPGLRGETVTFSGTVANIDSNPCPSATINLVVDGTAGFDTEISPTSLSLSPGASSAVTVTIESPMDAEYDEYPFAIEASDDQAPQQKDTKSVEYVVSPLDAISPTAPSGLTIAD